MTGRFGAFGLAMVILARAIMAAGAMPTTGPAAAEPWLARAEREILACPAETPKDLTAGQPHELAIMLYRLSPNSARQAMAIRLIDRAVAAEVARAKSADQLWGDYISGALCHAKVDDPAGARRMLAAADRPTHLPPTTEPMIRFARSFIDGFKAETLLRLGDRAAFKRVALPPLAADMTIDDLRADGLDAEAQFAAAWAGKQTAAEPGPATKPATTAASDLSDAAGFTPVDTVHKELASGNLAAAERAAAGIKRPSTTQPEGADMRDYYQAEAYALVAQASFRSGDFTRFHSGLDGFLAAARRDPAAYLSRQSQDLLELCARAKDQASFALLADTWRDSLAPKATSTPEDRIDYVEQISELARQCAAAGDIARYQSAVERAETVLAGVPPNDSRPDSVESAAHKRAIACSGSPPPARGRAMRPAWRTMRPSRSRQGRSIPMTATHPGMTLPRHAPMPADLTTRWPPPGKWKRIHMAFCPATSRGGWRMPDDSIRLGARCGELQPPSGSRRNMTWSFSRCAPGKRTAWRRESTRSRAPTNERSATSPQPARSSVVRMWGCYESSSRARNEPADNKILRPAFHPTSMKMPPGWGMRIYTLPMRRAYPIVMFCLLILVGLSYQLDSGVLFVCAIGAAVGLTIVQLTLEQRSRKKPPGGLQ